MDSLDYDRLVDISYDSYISDPEEFEKMSSDPDYAFNKMLAFFEDVAHRNPSLVSIEDIEKMKKTFWQKKFKEWLGEITEMPSP